MSESNKVLDTSAITIANAIELGTEIVMGIVGVQVGSQLDDVPMSKSTVTSIVGNRLHALINSRKLK